MTATTAKRLGEDRFGKLAFGTDVGRAVQILHGAAMSAIAACASHGHADIGKVDGGDADGGAAIAAAAADTLQEHAAGLLALGGDRPPRGTGIGVRHVSAIAALAAGAAESRADAGVE
jgi:hypothetical protein